MGKVRAFIDDESGATAIEYGLIALLVGVACVPALGVIAPKLGITWGKVGAKL